MRKQRLQGTLRLCAELGVMPPSLSQFPPAVTESGSLEVAETFPLASLPVPCPGTPQGDVSPGRRDRTTEQNLAVHVLCVAVLITEWKCSVCTELHCPACCDLGHRVDG